MTDSFEIDAKQSEMLELIDALFTEVNAQGYREHYERVVDQLNHLQPELAWPLFTTMLHKTSISADVCREVLAQLELTWDYDTLILRGPADVRQDQSRLSENETNPWSFVYLMNMLRSLYPDASTEYLCAHYLHFEPLKAMECAFNKSHPGNVTYLLGLYGMYDQVHVFALIHHDTPKEFVKALVGDRLSDDPMFMVKLANVGRVEALFCLFELNYPVMVLNILNAYCSVFNTQKVAYWHELNAKLGHFWNSDKFERAFLRFRKYMQKQFDVPFVHFLVRVNKFDQFRDRRAFEFTTEELHECDYEGQSVYTARIKMGNGIMEYEGCTLFMTDYLHLFGPYSPYSPHDLCNICHQLHIRRH